MDKVIFASPSSNLWLSHFWEAQFVMKGRHSSPIYFWLDEHSVSVARLCSPLRIQGRISYKPCTEGAQKLVRETETKLTRKKCS